MKTSKIMLLGAVVFTGVLGAQQVDHYLSRPKATQTGDLLPVTTKSPNLMRTSFEGAPGVPFDFSAAAKKVTPSVVSIDRYQRVGDFLNRDSAALRETGQGSGVIVSSNGTIVTNNHVVTDERTGEQVDQVKVRLSDDRTFTARVLGTDPRSDLAVLKIEAPNLTPIEMGASSDVEIGQWVLAVGNPLGFSNTVSAGVVSSLKRNLPVGNQGMVDAVQTDAAINPGNSGGALCNAQGQLIGVNSAIASRTGGSVGIGFAIPVDRVKVVVNDIVKLGYARYAGLGVVYDPNWEGVLAYEGNRERLSEMTGSQGFPDSGIIVKGVSGPAQSAGIGEYDVILAVDGQKVEGSFDLNKILIPKKPGDSVDVKFWSKGKTKTAKITLIEIRPERPA